MKKRSVKIYLLVFLGILLVPLTVIPSQVMNYLTYLLQSGQGTELSAIVPVITVFFFSILAVSILETIKTFVHGITLEERSQQAICNLFSRLLRTSPDFFRTNDAGKVSNRVLHETRRAELFWLSVETTLPVSLISLLGFSYVMFFGLGTDTPFIGPYIPQDYSQAGNWFLGGLILLLAPLQGTFLVMDRKIQTVNQRAMAVDDEMANTSLETIQNVAEIRSHNAFEFALDRVKSKLDSLRRLELDIAKIRSIFSGINPLLDGLSKVFLLGMGARLCVGDLNWGGLHVSAIAWKDYMGFAGVAMLVNGNIKGLSDLIFQWRLSKQMLRRVAEYNDTPKVFVEDVSAPKAAASDQGLAYVNLSVETPQGGHILNALNLKINPGEHVAFVGPSGCGKSTAMNVIVREMISTRGDVYLGEVPVTEIDFVSLTRELGYVRQKPVMFNMSLRENLLFGIYADAATQPDGAAQDAQLIDVVRKVGLTHDIIKKSLDAPLPKNRLGLDLARHIEKIRGEFQKKNSTDAIPYEKFSVEKILNNATVGENIFFGKTSAVIQSAGQNKSPSALLLDTCSEGQLIDHLLILAIESFRNGSNVFEKLAKENNRIQKKIRNTFHESEHGHELNLQKITVSGSFFNREELIVLLDAALALDMNLALSTAPIPLEQEILTCRKRLSASNARRCLASGFDQPSAESLALREVLIGGRVDKKVHGATGAIDEKILEILNECGLSDDLVLAGLENKAGSQGQFLSGGQAMKLAIARVLMKKPSVLLLDEATAALDEQSQAQIVALIENEFRDKTVISISHRLSTIRHFDQIFVFDRGQVVQSGTYTELVRQPGLFRFLVEQENSETLPPLKESVTTSSSQSRVAPLQENARHALSVAPLFKDLRGEHLMLLDSIISYRYCKQGTVLFRRGDAGDELFVLLDGEIVFSNDNDSEGTIVDRCGPGTVFGELALFGRVPRTMGARATQECRFGVIQRDDLIGLIRQAPDISLMLLETVSRRLAKERGVGLS